MDRDAIIESFIREPASYVRCVRIAGRGAYVASVVVRGAVIADGRGSSLSAALDGLAQALTATRAA